MKKAKIGDIIEWTILIDLCSGLRGNTYQSEVVVIHNGCYGVYAEYG